MKFLRIGKRERERERFEPALIRRTSLEAKNPIKFVKII